MHIVENGFFFALGAVVRGVLALPVRFGRKLERESVMSNQIAERMQLGKRVDVYQTPVAGWFDCHAHGCSLLPGVAGITVLNQFRNFRF